MTGSEVQFNVRFYFISEIENGLMRQSFVGLLGRIELQVECVKGAH